MLRAPAAEKTKVRLVQGRFRKRHSPDIYDYWIKSQGPCLAHSNLCAITMITAIKA